MTTHEQSTDPWLCENPQHAHTDSRRTSTCRPDSLRHPAPENDGQHQRA